MFETGLPSNLKAEEFVLGSVLLDHRHAMPQIGVLREDDFSMDKHRKIYRAMCELDSKGADIDYLTVVNLLDKQNNLEAVGGISAVSNLTDGLPKLENLSSYVEIVKEKSRLRKIIYTNHTMMARALEKQDSKELLSWGVNALVEVDEQADTGFVKIGELIEADTKVLLSNDRNGIETDLVELNNITGGGLRLGELVLIGARPGMGKTAMALGMARFLCQQGHPCLFFSLEMNRLALILRLLAMHARIDLRRLRGNYIDGDEERRVWAALAELREWPLYIHDSSSQTIEEMLLTVRAVRKRLQPKAVFVDYIQIVRTAERYTSRVQEVTVISQGLMHMAKSSEVAVVALSQLSRESERRGAANKRPQLSDLRDSGSLEQDAHLVILLHRPEVYLPDREDLQGLADAIIAKQRNGPTGDIKLAFLRNYAKFENLATGYETEEAGQEEAPF